MNNNKTNNIYKILFWIIVSLFIVDALLRFCVYPFLVIRPNALRIIFVWLIAISVVIIGISLVALYNEARKGQVVGFSERLYKRNPYLRIVLISFVIALLYAFIMWYGYSLMNVISMEKGFFQLLKIALALCIGWCGLGVVYTFLAVFVVVFANLTIAWHIAKKKREKQLSKE